MHQPPNVPNYGRPGRGPKLVEGLALAVEPMITLGSKETVVLDDDWTVVTADGSWAAHFEHTFTLTPDGRLGADRPRRRRGDAGRARRAVRRALSRSASPPCRPGHGTMGRQEGSIPVTVVSSVRPGLSPDPVPRLRSSRAEETSGE